MPESEPASSSTGSLTVAIGQIASSTDRERNLRSIRRAARRARDRGASLLLLPEYAAYATNALDERIVANAEPVDGPFVGALAEIAVEFELHIVAGMSECAPGDTRAYNSLVVVDASGSVPN